MVKSKLLGHANDHSTVYYDDFKTERGNTCKAPYDFVACTMTNLPLYYSQTIPEWQFITCNG